MKVPKSFWETMSYTFVCFVALRNQGRGIFLLLLLQCSGKLVKV